MHALQSIWHVPVKQQHVCCLPVVEYPPHRHLTPSDATNFIFQKTRKKHYSNKTFIGALMKRPPSTQQEGATPENAQRHGCTSPRLASPPLTALHDPFPLFSGFGRKQLVSWRQQPRLAARFFALQIKGALKEMAEVSARVKELQVSTAYNTNSTYRTQW